MLIRAIAVAALTTLLAGAVSAQELIYAEFGTEHCADFDKGKNEFVGSLVIDTEARTVDFRLPISGTLLPLKTQMWRTKAKQFNFLASRVVDNGGDFPDVLLVFHGKIKTNKAGVAKKATGIAISGFDDDCISSAVFLAK